MSRRRIDNTHMFLNALRMAEVAHEGQKRKGSGLPYVYHPINVALIVSGFKQSKHLTEILCACIFHDCLEDTALTFEEIARDFSPLVASLVQELTNDKAEIARIGKLAYHKKKLVGMSSWGLYIKLGDRIDNISDNPTAKMVDDTLLLMEHLKKNRKLTKAQSAMVAEIISLCEQKK